MRYLEVRPVTDDFHRQEAAIELYEGTDSIGQLTRLPLWADPQVIADAIVAAARGETTRVEKP